MKRNHLMEVLLLIVTILFTSCEKDKEPLERNTYKIKISFQGNTDNFHLITSVSNSLSNQTNYIYNVDGEKLLSPYSLTQDEFKKETNIYYYVCPAIYKPWLSIGATAYQFLENKEPIDTLKLEIKGFMNDTIMVVDTTHIFRSYTKEEIEIYHDSIQKHNTFHINIANFIP